MKRIGICVLLLVLGACDEAPKSDTSKPVTEVPTGKEVSKEVAGGVRDVLAKKGPKWKVEYSGDLSGNLEGSILTAMSVSTTTSVVGKGMAKDMKGAAAGAFQATFMTGNDDNNRMVNTNLTLGDGTKCQEEPKSGLSKGKLIDKESKTFKAEVSGTLVCGPDKAKKITYKATLAK